MEGACSTAGAPSGSTMSKPRCGRSGAASSSPAKRPSTCSGQLVEQHSRLLEIRRVKALGEPAVDRREKVARLGAAALVAAKPGEAHGGAQFPELGLLLLGDAEGFAIQFLGGLGLPLPQQQLAFVPVELRVQPALTCPFNDLYCRSTASELEYGIWVPI